MSHIRQTTIALITAISLSFSLVGCIGITGLKIEKVKEIMGEPTEQQSGGIGLGGIGIKGNTMTWKDGNRSISIMFLNDQAISKSQNGL